MADICLIRNIYGPQTDPDSQPRLVPAQELHSRAGSRVGITSLFQRSQHRKQCRRKADKKNKKKHVSLVRHIYSI